MNQGLFNKYMGHRPSQRHSEWRTFLEICEACLKRQEIEKPFVVELGAYKNRQKRFYEKLLGARHISIDASSRRGNPDILGNTHDPKTMENLKRKLEGNPINILFIDASHRYEDVKKDFELYSPLCADIIAFHDIETHRFDKMEKLGVWRFWDELKTLNWKGAEAYADFLFISIQGKKNHMGIGVIIKR